jgi:hypothetical protein
MQKVVFGSPARSDSAKQWDVNTGRTIFSQLMDFLPAYEFQKCVSRYRGDHKVQNFSCRDQFLSMAFAQLTYRESLRDIETCLQSIGSELYHMGFRSKVARSTLADANESRDWRIYADFCASLDRYRAPALCQRSDRCRSGPESVCFGLHHHRSLPLALSLGQVS